MEDVAPVLRTAIQRVLQETDEIRKLADGNDPRISELAATLNDVLKRLDEAFAAQQRFIDDAGHELRTPITVIRGHLELMEDDPSDRRRTLQLVSDQLERMTRIVDDVVTLARSEHPDFLHARAVDVDELTVRIIQNARSLGPREWRLDAVATTRVRLDEQLMMQAVLELASNAVRHTDDGELIAIGSSADAGHIRMWVRNGGPGLTADESRQIFERFYRGSTGHGRSDGAGLGLPIVKAIAEAHGGTVEVSGGAAETVFAIVVPAVGGGSVP